mmetsp:Transcript_8803/g.14999  ORF Transcript_8803/g.14999 Transcript_8803/m.14999 type:complete len:221 (+) Transcript_8803:60-722(+)
MERLELLESRVQALEKKMEEPVQRVLRDLKEKEVYNYQMLRVAEDYYSRSLEQRAALLKAKSTFHLCKTIVMENKNYVHDPSSESEFNITNSRYYCIVIQYEHKLDAEKLRDFVLALKPPGERLPRKRYHFHLAPEKVNDEMTGFFHNAVCPFGLSTPIPVLLCASCLQLSPPFLWMGGGEVNVKLGIPVSDFIRATGAFVADVSDPRQGTVAGGDYDED